MASDIVADAKAWLEWRPPARPSQDGRTHYEGCHAEHTDCLIERLVAEVERHRMTERERKAVACAAAQEELLAMVNDDDVSQWHTDRALALRALLGRTAPEEVGRE